MSLHFDVVAHFWDLTQASDIQTKLWRVLEEEGG